MGKKKAHQNLWTAKVGIFDYSGIRNYREPNCMELFFVRKIGGKSTNFI